MAVSETLLLNKMVWNKLSESPAGNPLSGTRYPVHTAGLAHDVVTTYCPVLNENARENPIDPPHLKILILSLRSFMYYSLFSSSRTMRTYPPRNWKFKVGSKIDQENQ